MQNDDDAFQFTVNDVVLADWENKLYYAKILSINHTKSKCRLLFDDGSSATADFTQIHHVNETTFDILCVVCKEDSTSPGNEIVLCDSCSIGFHQRCHDPTIPPDALEYFTPWVCCYCGKGSKNPHIEKNPFGEHQSSKEQFSESSNTTENQESIQQRCQGELDNCEIRKSDSQMPMNDNYENQMNQVKNNIESRRESQTRNTNEHTHSNHGERKDHDMSIDRKRSRDDVFNRDGSRRPNFYQKGYIASPKDRGGENRSKDWRQRLHDDYWRKGGFNNNFNTKTSGRNNFRGGRSHAREFSKSDSRGSKYHKGNLREKMAKRYMPNHFSFSSLNKHHTQDIVNNNLNNDKESTRMKYNQRRSDFHKEGSGPERSRGEAKRPVEPRHHHERTFDQFSKSYEPMNKKFRRDCISYRQDFNASYKEDKCENETQKSTRCEPGVSKILKDNLAKEETQDLSENAVRSMSDLEMQRSGSELSDTDEQSAFKFVKDCLRSRPGSLLRHQQELVVNFKKTMNDERETVFQCKHSDAVELKRDCTIDILPTADKDIMPTADNACDDTINYTSISEMTSVQDTVKDSTSSVFNKVSLKASKSTEKQYDDSKTKTDTSSPSNSCNIVKNDAGSGILFVADKDQSTLQGKSKLVEPKMAGICSYNDAFDRKTEDKNACKKEEFQFENISDKEDDRGVLIDDEKVLKRVGQLKEISLFLDTDVNEKMAGNLKAEKCMSADGSSINSLTDSTFINKHRNNIEEESGIKRISWNETDQTNQRMDIGDKGGLSKSDEKDRSVFFRGGTKSLENGPESALINTKKESYVKIGGSDLIQNTADVKNALTIAKETNEGSSLSINYESETVNGVDKLATNEKEIDVEMESMEIMNCKAEIDMIKVETESHQSKFVLDRTEQKKDERKSDRIVTSDIENRQVTVFSNATFKDTGLYAGTLPGSSSKDLIVECSEDVNGGMSLGIRISDVFSLKKERMVESDDGYQHRAYESKDRNESYRNESRGREEQDKDDDCGRGDKLEGSAEEKIELHRKEESMHVANKGKEESHQEERLSENASPIFGLPVEKGHHKGTKGNQKSQGELCHTMEGDIFDNNDNNNVVMKGRKIAKKARMSADDSPLSEECQIDQTIKRKRKKKKIRAISSPCDANQSDRLSFDLPRHNWLIERLLNEKKLETDVIEEEKPLEESQDEESIPKTNKRRKKGVNNENIEKSDNRSKVVNGEVKVLLDRSKVRDDVTKSSDIGSSSAGASDCSIESTEMRNETCKSKIRKQEFVEEKLQDSATLCDKRLIRKSYDENIKEFERPIFNAESRKIEERKVDDESETLSPTSLRISIHKSNVEASKVGTEYQKIEEQRIYSECEASSPTSLRISISKSNVEKNGVRAKSKTNSPAVQDLSGSRESVSKESVQVNSKKATIDGGKKTEILGALSGGSNETEDERLKTAKDENHQREDRRLEVEDNAEEIFKKHVKEEKVEMQLSCSENGADKNYLADSGNINLTKIFKNTCLPEAHRNERKESRMMFEVARKSNDADIKSLSYVPCMDFRVTEPRRTSTDTINSAASSSYFKKRESDHRIPELPRKFGDAKINNANIEFNSSSMPPKGRDLRLSDIHSMTVDKNVKNNISAPTSSSASPKKTADAGTNLDSHIPSSSQMLQKEKNQMVPKLPSKSAGANVSTACSVPSSGHIPTRERPPKALDADVKSASSVPSSTHAPPKGKDHRVPELQPNPADTDVENASAVSRNRHIPPKGKDQKLAESQPKTADADFKHASSVPRNRHTPPEGKDQRVAELQPKPADADDKYAYSVPGNSHLQPKGKDHRVPKLPRKSANTNINITTSVPNSGQVPSSETDYRMSDYDRKFVDANSKSASCLPNNSALQPKKEDSRILEHDGVKPQLQNQAFPRRDVPDYDYPMLPVAKNFHYHLHDYRVNTNPCPHPPIVHLPSNGAVNEAVVMPTVHGVSQMQLMLNHSHDKTFAKYKDMKTQQSTDIYSSYASSVTSHQNLVQPIGHSTVEKLPSNERYIPPGKIDVHQSSSAFSRHEVRKEVSNRKPVDAPRDVAEKLHESERSQVSKEVLEKTSFNDKAEIILGIIEDKSISDATKHELLNYWRSLRSIPTTDQSHDMQERQGGTVTAEKALREQQQARVSPFRSNARKVEAQNNSQCSDLALRLTAQVADALKYPIITQAVSKTSNLQPIAESYDSKLRSNSELGPTLTNIGESNLSRSSEISLRGGFNANKRPLSDPVFRNESVETLPRRPFAVHRLPDSSRNSTQSNHCLPEKRLPPTIVSKQAANQDIIHQHLSVASSASNPVFELPLRPEIAMVKKQNNEKTEVHMHGPEVQLSRHSLAPLPLNGVLRTNHVNHLHSTQIRSQPLANDVQPMQDWRKQPSRKEEEFLQQRELELLRQRELEQRREFEREQELIKRQQMQQQQHQMQQHMQQQQLFQMQQTDQHKPFQQQQHQILQHKQQLQHQQQLQQQHQEYLKHQEMQHNLQQQQQMHQKQKELLKQQELEQIKQQQFEALKRLDEEEIFRQQRVEWLRHQEQCRFVDERHLGQHAHEKQQRHLSYMQQLQRSGIQQQQITSQQYDIFVEEKFILSPTVAFAGQQSQPQSNQQMQKQLLLQSQPQIGYQKSNAVESPLAAFDKEHKAFSGHRETEAKQMPTSPRFGSSKIKNQLPAINNSGSSGALTADPLCQSCGTKANFLCSRCRNAWYCSENCQVREWKEHGKSCKKNQNQ